MNEELIRQAACQGVRHDGLMCRVRRLEYDFETRRGALFLPPCNCTDMGGCIALFRRVDRHVKRIETWAGTDQDTTYVRGADGWQALPSPHRRF